MAAGGNLHQKSFIKTARSQRAKFGETKKGSACFSLPCLPCFALWRRNGCAAFRRKMEHGQYSQTALRRSRNSFWVEPAGYRQRTVDSGCDDPRFEYGVYRRDGRERRTAGIASFAAGEPGRRAMGGRGVCPVSGGGAPDL